MRISQGVLLRAVVRAGGDKQVEALGQVARQAAEDVEPQQGELGDLVEHVGELRPQGHVAQPDLLLLVLLAEAPRRGRPHGDGVQRGEGGLLAVGRLHRDPVVAQVVEPCGAGPGSNDPPTESATRWASSFMDRAMGFSPLQKERMAKSTRTWLMSMGALAAGVPVPLAKGIGHPHVPGVLAHAD